MIKTILAKGSKSLSITFIIGVLFVIYVFTLGARITKARNIFLFVNDKYNLNSEDLSQNERADIAEKLNESLDLWYDPEVEMTLNMITNPQ